MSTFQDNLKSYRERLGINAKDFAAQLGIKYTTYANYENAGSEPKYDTLCRIAAALHVSIDDLLGYKVDRLEYWLNRLGERFDCIESSPPGAVTLLYWDNEDWETGGNATMQADYTKEELTALLESLGERAEKITASTTREIMQRDVIANLQLKVLGALPITLSVDVENKTKKSPPIDGRD